MICPHCGQDSERPYTNAELGNVFEPQPCSVEDCMDECEGECCKGDVDYDVCARRRKAIEAEATEGRR